MISSHSNVVFGYVVYAGFKRLKEYFSGKVYLSLYEKIMKPVTSQDTK
jgi:hypothetical protein